VSDLTPIQREFCWHLARDLYVQVNGDVLICKQLDGDPIGNILKDDLGSIWNKGLESFSLSLNGEHQKISAPCLSCDEWYTFNA
jgi:radical SAM protein with 4Fe4S-binding SPASM domain